MDMSIQGRALNSKGVMSLDAVKSAYRRYAGVYDVLFGPIMHPGRQRIVSALGCRPGDAVLEVGVGTGLSLPLYPSHVRVTGIDVSREMLARARRRVAREELSHVEAIQEMDAQDMSFSDARFDKVVAMYVVSVVPDPARLLAEMRRVCKPAGDIYIVNHFRSRNSALASFETWLAPISKLAGFRTNLGLEDVLAQSALQVETIRDTNLFGYWKILHLRNLAAPISATACVLDAGSCNGQDDADVPHRNFRLLWRTEPG
jgi:phosphatidylethanolamine/phosphatidyl-N-methylethanolamine N-methyltransferase